VRLDLDNEPQPDAVLFIEYERGGQAHISEDNYIQGPPELAAELASRSVSYDLGVKLHIFRRNGVSEYVVWRVLDKEIDWFELREGDYARLGAGADGWLRSEVFPGLWLDSAALIRGNIGRVLAVLQLGLASPEHANFVARLHPRTPKP
jgi:Uma2 family endonuclease